MLQDLKTVEAEFLAYLRNHTGRPDAGPETGVSFEQEQSIAFYERDLTTHKSTFMSEVFEKITGYPTVKVKEEANFIFQLIPSGELARVLSAGRKAFDYIMQLAVEDRKGSCMRFDFPIVRKDGTVIWLRDVITVTELDGEGKVYRVGGYMIDITKQKSNTVRGQVESLSGNVLLINTESAIFFSKREIEILRLINEGLASKEVALKLEISVNTVNNHRSNMMHRNQVRNMIEVLRIAREHNAI